MYYSKRGSEGVAVPRNYSGSLFRVVDESERNAAERKMPEPTESERGKEENKHSESGLVTLSHIFSGISVEELLLVGLMTVIHRDDPDDPILLVLLVLLMAK